MEYRDRATDSANFTIQLEPQAEIDGNALLTGDYWYLIPIQIVN